MPRVVCTNGTVYTRNEKKVDQKGETVGRPTTTTDDAVRISGATYSQLYRWARKGWLDAYETARGVSLGPWTATTLRKATWLAVASEHFCPDGKIRLEALADFVRRAAEAGVKP